MSAEFYPSIKLAGGVRVFWKPKSFTRPEDGLEFERFGLLSGDMGEDAHATVDGLLARRYDSAADSRNASGCTEMRRGDT